jgi:2-polyprenyl-3-methyl-5-hydroxy-6-metoxy-1,4-benzoquinol methylase
MENVNSTYFNGYYKDIWRSYIPAELTVKEVDFMVRHFNLQPESKVLDIMCGYGRHAIALAEKGISVTAVDNLEDYTDELSETARSRNLPIEALEADVIQYEADQMFDLAICMGNSICFFNREDTLKLLKMISSHLVHGGYLLINTWMLAEIAFNGFREKAWDIVGDLKFITESKYFLQPSRIETDHLIIAPDGTSETKKAVDYIYSIAEMEVMLSECKLVMKDVYSIPGKKKFTLGEPRAYIIAQKM